METLSNSDLILKNFTTETPFSALSYAKHSGCEEYTKCKTSLSNALKAISVMNVKQHNEHKLCILWSRKAIKEVNKLLDKAVIKQYFYMKTRQNYIATKRNISQRIKSNEANELVETIEDENDATIDINTCSVDNGTEENNIELEEQFKKFESSKKWYLSTGKCADDELFIFSLQCNYDHPAKSFIMDPDDQNFTLYKVFTPAELKEITQYKEQKRPEPSKDLLIFFKFV